ncbi:MAG: tetratricopeptide repeat protein, partial [Chlorobi bacterium]|nr:tetratricopeptide repeat protein [Chlorobiota bacterium]
TKAYLYFYEKFHPYSYVLDSARHYLSKLPPEKHPKTWIHYYYLTEQYDNIINLVPLVENDTFLDGWTAYRIAIAYKHQKMLKKALHWLEKATSLLPYQLDFQNELGTTLAMLGDWQQAERVFRFIVNEDPYHYKAWNNLGYLYLLKGKPRIAITYFQKALSLDPDYTQASVNLQRAYQMLGKTMN